MRASHGRLARAGLAILIVLAGAAAVSPGAFAERLSPEHRRAITRKLFRALEADPGVIKKRWFLRAASAVTFVLPVTIRLLPARDGVPHYVSNDSVGNYATLDLGTSLGSRVIGLGGAVNADIRFHDAYDAGQPGDVDVLLIPDDSAVQSTSIGLLANPDVSTQTAGQNHVDLLDLGGASAGTFSLRWVSPSNGSYTIGPISPAGLDEVALTGALQAVLGANNVFASQDGAGRFRITFSGRYTDPPGGLNPLQVTANLTGAPVTVTTVAAGRASNGGCVGFAGGNPADVDAIENMQPSLDPGANNVGPNWQWTPLGGANERDVVMRTGPLMLYVDGDRQAVVPAGAQPGLDAQDNGAAGVTVGYSGGKANIFGLPVDGLPDGNSVDVTVNLKTRVSTIFRQVDNAFPQPAGGPDETLGNIGAYFDCRQLWTGYVENHLIGIHLTGRLHISPALTADGRLRIAKIFLASPEPAREALAACVVPFSLYAAGNPATGDSTFTSDDSWRANPLAPDLLGGSADSAHFNPQQALNPLAAAQAPDVPCDSKAGPLDRNPFDVFAGGNIPLDSLLKAGGAVAVAGDLTVQKLVGEVLIGPFPQLPPVPVAPASAQLVAGIRVTSGKAGLKGRTGCVAKPFDVSVRGTSMARVIFKVDGRVVDRFPSVIGGKATIRINPRRIKAGLHRVIAIVTFKPAAHTKRKTLRLSFERCTHLAKPRFTG